MFKKSTRKKLHTEDTEARSKGRISSNLVGALRAPEQLSSSKIESEPDSNSVPPCPPCELSYYFFRSLSFVSVVVGEMASGSMLMWISDGLRDSTACWNAVANSLVRFTWKASAP